MSNYDGFALTVEYINGIVRLHKDGKACLLEGTFSLKVLLGVAVMSILEAFPRVGQTLGNTIVRKLGFGGGIRCEKILDPIKLQIATNAAIRISVNPGHYGSLVGYWFREIDVILTGSVISKVQAETIKFIVLHLEGCSMDVVQDALKAVVVKYLLTEYLMQQREAAVEILQVAWTDFQEAFEKQRPGLLARLEEAVEVE